MTYLYNAIHHAMLKGHYYIFELTSQDCNYTKSVEEVRETLKVVFFACLSFLYKVLFIEEDWRKISENGS